MKIHARRAFAAAAAILVAQAGHAAPVAASAKAPAAPTSSASAPVRTDATDLQAAEAARRDADPQLNGSVKDRPQTSAAVAKR